MTWLKSIWLFILQLFGISDNYKTETVEELPDKLRAHRIYLIGEDGEFWFAAMKCPCGCNETIQLSLLPDERPHWRYESHNNGTVSLAPSVWRTKGCKSHFFVRRGEIDWCTQTANNLKMD